MVQRLGFLVFTQAARVRLPVWEHLLLGASLRYLPLLVVLYTNSTRITTIRCVSVICPMYLSMSLFEICNYTTLKKKISICYYTGSHSVWLAIFTSLTYFVKSGRRDKIQRRVKIYSGIVKYFVKSGRRDKIQRRVKIYSGTDKLYTTIQQKNEFSTIDSAEFDCRFTVH